MSAKQTIRSFIAVDVGEAIRQRAADLVDELRQAGANVTWVKPQNMHLTLKFLGDVQAADVPHICDAVQQAVARSEPFEFEVRGVGAFPRITRPGAVWLGGGDGTERMAELADRIEGAMRKLGFPREGRRFQPHLTLGRVRGGGPAIQALAELLRQHADFQAGRTEIDEVVIFSSELHPSGPTYEALCRVPLGS
jgi:2'-5' RNA ligase